MADRDQARLPCPCGGKLYAKQARHQNQVGRPYIRRTRYCNECGTSFTSYEFIVEAHETMVISRRGRGEATVIQSIFAWKEEIAKIVTERFSGVMTKYLGKEVTRYVHADKG